MSETSASDAFAFDVFLSYSAKDRDVVHALAERLRSDGVRVWLDAWEIRPGDSIPAKLEEGLEASRRLVLCMSANAAGSDWMDGAREPDLPLQGSAQQEPQLPAVAAR